jgi:hypothetical protein
MTESPLEGLKTKFCCVGIVLALGHLDELRTDKTLQFNCLCHLFVLSSRSHPAPNAR